jgi:hypothetical protein
MKKLPAMAMLALAAAAMEPMNVQRGLEITNPYANLGDDFKVKRNRVNLKGLRFGLNQRQKRKAWANNPRIRPLKNRK